MIEVLAWWANALGVAMLGVLGVATVVLFVVVLVSSRGQPVIGGRRTWWCRWFGCRWLAIGRRYRMCVRRGCTRFEEAP